MIPRIIRDGTPVLEVDQHPVDIIKELYARGTGTWCATVLLGSAEGGMVRELIDERPRFLSRKEGKSWA
jgi:hypothetical protein